MVVVLILVVAWTWWGVVTWRDRRQTSGRRVNSIASFSNHLSILERSTPAPSGVVVRNASGAVVGPYRPPVVSAGFAAGPAADRLRNLVTGAPLGSTRSPIGGMSQTLTLSQAQQRRRQLVFGLAGALVVTSLLALAIGGVFVSLALVVLAAAVTYGVLLVRARRVEIERLAKVRTLGSQPAVAPLAAAYAETGTYGAGGFATQALGHGVSAYGDETYGEPSHGYAADDGLSAGGYEDSSYGSYADGGYATGSYGDDALYAGYSN